MTTLYYRDREPRYVARRHITETDNKIRQRGRQIVGLVDIQISKQSENEIDVLASCCFYVSIPMSIGKSCVVLRSHNNARLPLFFPLSLSSLSVSLFRNQPVKYRPIDNVWVKITTISNTRERAALRIRILLKTLLGYLKGSLFHFISVIHYSNYFFLFTFANIILVLSKYIYMPEKNFLINIIRRDVYSVEPMGFEDKKHISNFYDLFDYIFVDLYLFL